MQTHTMELTTVLLAALVTYTLVAGAPSEDRVYGGSTQTSSIPYLVSITVDDQHTCGGFIYNENYVVTAASCVDGITASRVKVIVAQLSLIQLDPSEESLPIFKIFTYDTYDSTTKLHDIAMLQMANPMTFGPKVGFLNYDEAEEVPDTVVELAGWGGTQEGGLPSTKLRKISVTVPAVCSITYPGTEFNPNYMLCAGSTTDVGSPCHYDEGSPLVQTVGTYTYAIGIMSKNKACGPGADPSVYTRLTSYYSWFNKIAGLQPVP